MNDIQSKVREHIEETVPPIDIDKLVEQLTQTEQATRWLQPKRTSGGHRRWVPVLAGAAAILLLIGGAALLNRPEEPPAVTQPTTAAPTTVPDLTPDETTPTPTTSLPSPTTVPTMVEPGPVGPWTRQDIRGNDLRASSIAPGGRGFIAAGHTYTGGDVWGRGQIWTSADGTFWRAVVGDGALFEEGHFALGVLSNGSGVVVWGNNDRQGGTVIWHASDGVVWNLVTTGDPPLDGANVTDGLALASGGYVLYGVLDRCYVETGTCTPVDLPRIVRSPDGITWEMFTTPVTFTAIVQTETGELLAAGGRISEPTTWISQDEGRTWQLHGPDRSIESGRSAEVWTMEETPYGLIAAGVDTENKPMLWISEDGRTFTPTLQVPPFGPEHDEYNDMVQGIAFGDGWVIAVGSDSDGPAMWASEDGREWLSVSLEGTYLGGAGLNDITYRDSVFVAVGEHRYEIGGEALVLRWEPPGE